MITYDDVLLEMQMRRSSLEAEAQHERQARLAATGRRQPAREPGIGRMSVRLGDFVAGFLIQLQSRLASEPSWKDC